MSALRVGFCVSGKGRLFRETVSAQRALGILPALLIADHTASPDLEAFCAAADIPMWRLPADDPGYRIAIARLRDEDLDLLCLTFDRILPPEVVAPLRGRIVNVHLALLPAFRGKRALERALAADVRYAGATIHEVTDELDRGPVIAQCVAGIERDDTAEAIDDRVYALLRPMYLQVIAWYAQGRVTRDERGRIRVRDASYGGLPVSPALEHDR